MCIEGTFAKENEGWEVDSLVKLSMGSYNRRAGQIANLSNIVPVQLNSQALCMEIKMRLLQSLYQDFDMFSLALKCSASSKANLKPLISPL
jgi:hypothetical protein